MKSARFVLFAVLMSLATTVFAQSHMHTLVEAAVPQDAQKAFDTLKTLAGTWEGRVMVVPPDPSMDNAPMQISLRVTSRGNALVHEMQAAGTPQDPTKYDHPVTMFYLDGDRLTLVHYCDAGNRPRMVARTSPDGKTLDFDFVDVSGSTQFGHMQHATFTIVDADHHSEEWTYLMPGDKPMHARMDLQRTK
jgi:hypothetical protein